MKNRLSHNVKPAISRKRKSDVSRQDEHFYKTLAESSPDMIFLVDSEGVIQYLNMRAAQAFGQTPADLIGKQTAEAFPQEIARHFMDELNLVVTTKEQRLIEILEQFPTGARWMSTRLVPMHCSGKKGITILGISTDITESKLAAEALRESEEKYRTLTNNSPNMIYLIDTEGYIRFINPVAAAQFGLSPEELIGKHLHEIFPLPLAEQHLKAIHLVLSQGTKLCRDIKDTFPTGERWIDACLTPFKTADGNVIGVLGISNDISERKQAEEALQKVNKQLNLLSSLTRHDILNQLTALMMYLESVREKIDDPETIADLDKSLQLSSMIQTQIEFTRDYQDLGTREPQWIHLDTVMPRSQVPATITLNAIVQDVLVFADPMLEKVFFNLLDNSIRHGQRVTEIRVSSHQSDGNLVVVWEDNGTGIAANEKARIFDRGFGKNTGLGLFLTREILSITGITITENGIPGMGARFEIMIPKNNYRIENT